MYEERTYRKKMRSNDLISFIVQEEESDLFLSANINLEAKTKESLHMYREQLLSYGKSNPVFFSSFEPLLFDSEAPPIVQEMLKAGELAGVGPMAAVAGAISEFVGNDLLKDSEEILVENGGDIFLRFTKARKVMIYAGRSSFSNHLMIEIRPEQTPLGICTSAGSVGHSVSLGKADAVVVLAKNTLVADAFATRIGNMIKNEDDIQRGLDFAKGIGEIKGIIIIMNDKMGIWGDITLIE